MIVNIINIVNVVHVFIVESKDNRVSRKSPQIMQQYRRDNPKHNLVFPDLETVKNFYDAWEVEKLIKSRTHLIGDHLALVSDAANIDKKLCPHIARHTFGNISGNQIPVKTLQKLYRHTHLSKTVKANWRIVFQFEDGKASLADYLDYH